MLCGDLPEHEVLVWIRGFIFKEEEIISIYLVEFVANSLSGHFPQKITLEVKFLSPAVYVKPEVSRRLIADVSVLVSGKRLLLLRYFFLFATKG